MGWGLGALQVLGSVPLIQRLMEWSFTEMQQTLPSGFSWSGGRGRLLHGDVGWFVLEISAGPGGGTKVGVSSWGVGTVESSLEELTLEARRDRAEGVL